MSYALIVDSTGNVLSKIEEYNRNGFIVRCYNFSQDEGLEKLNVIISGPVVRSTGFIYDRQTRNAR